MGDFIEENKKAIKMLMKLIRINLNVDRMIDHKIAKPLMRHVCVTFAGVSITLFSHRLVISTRVYHEVGMSLANIVFSTLPVL